jgi:excisionase family DNA binding protein
MSSWLPPGLALGGLAVLATFIHGVGKLLTAWAAMVSLIVLLARRRPRVSSRSPSKTAGDPTESSVTAPHDSAAPNSPTAPHTRPTSPGGEERTAASTAPSADMTEKAATSASHSPSLTSEPRPMPDATVSETADQAKQLSAAEAVAQPELRVLTAAEVASMLRVDANVVIAAISAGELPGNRVGDHWRVGQGALTRWLRGTYRSHADPPGSSSPMDHRTDPT